MMRKYFFALWLIILGGSFITGCTTTLGHEIDQSAYQEIKKGTSTKADVVELLGDPNQEVENEDGTTTFVYTFTKISHGIYGLGAGVDTQEAKIRFNSKGIVVGKSKQNGDTGGTGMGGGGVK